MAAWLPSFVAPNSLTYKELEDEVGENRGTPSPAHLLPALGRAAFATSPG